MTRIIAIAIPKPTYAVMTLPIRRDVAGDSINLEICARARTPRRVADASKGRSDSVSGASAAKARSADRLTGDPEMTDRGSILREIREEQGVSQWQLAEMARVNRNALRRFEKNDPGATVFLAERRGR